MPIQIKRRENTSDDLAQNATKVNYTAESGLSPTVASLGVDTYLNSIDLKISVKGDKAAANIQTALKERGLDATLTDLSGSGTEARMLTVTNADEQRGIVTLITTLAKLGDKPGGISHDAANQIIEMELESTLKTPSQLGLASVKTTPAQKRFADRTPPAPYVDVKIDYALSPVAYLNEDSRPSDKGSERFTRMGLRNTQASTEIFKALAMSGITSETVSVDSDNVTFVNVAASADTVSGVLKDTGLMLPSIAAEIKEATAAAHASTAQTGKPQQSGKSI